MAPTVEAETCVFATPGVPLECTIYTDGKTIREDSRNPVFLFFHSGGLVGGHQNYVPPWLVCLQRRWPLISASYRLLPQVDGNEILDDALAAYKFARHWGLEQNDLETHPGRAVIVGGASAGLFVATLLGHHATSPPPLALLGITGISSFRYPFFNSSTVLPPRRYTEADVQPFLVDTSISSGTFNELEARNFFPHSVLANGAKNPNHKDPRKIAEDDGNNTAGQGHEVSRGELYEYFVAENQFLSMVNDVDLCWDWATKPSNNHKLTRWPDTIFIVGETDIFLDERDNLEAAKALGPEKATVFLAKGQGHLFEASSFLEDADYAMDVVREAVKKLDDIVSNA